MAIKTNNGNIFTRAWKRVTGVGALEAQLAQNQAVDFRELAAANKWGETGTSGLQAWGGYVDEAYAAEVRWPACIPLYDRIWRSDPEVAIARLVMETLASDIEIGWELPEHIGSKDLGAPSADDKAAQEFGYEVLDDIEGGIGEWLKDAMARVPFYGWGWWEVVPGVRKEDWRPPQSDPWRSDYDDGLVGYRRLAFRRYSSFYGWEMDDYNKRLIGLKQSDPPNQAVTIPTDRSLHVTFGDSTNPEGLATLEAMWRLERYKYGLETVQGFGFQHTAGHLAVNPEATATLTETDLAKIKAAARAIMTPQEGNYAVFPPGWKGEIIDSSFGAAAALLEAIRYYGVLKLGLLQMQWVALGTLSPYGSYSTAETASELFYNVFNSMVEGFVRQADEQIGKRLFDYPINRDAFPGMTRRPRLAVVHKAQKSIELAKLGQFMTSLNAISGLGEEDIIAIRKQSGFLPEIMPTELVESPKPEPDTTQQGEGAEDSVDGEGTPTEEPEQADDKAAEKQAGKDTEQGEMAQRLVTVGDDEYPTDEWGADVTEKDIDRAARKFEKWAQEHDPAFAKLLKAKVKKEEEGE